jgi:hypothetical protein
MTPAGRAKAVFTAGTLMTGYAAPLPDQPVRQRRSEPPDSVRSGTS